MKNTMKNVCGNVVMFAKKDEKATNENWGTYQNHPFLKDILDEVTTTILESKSYLSEAYTIRDAFLEAVRDTLGNETPSFISILAQNMAYELITDLDLEFYGYASDSYEAEVWKEFCWDMHGLCDILESEYFDFFYEVAEEMLSVVV